MRTFSTQSDRSSAQLRASPADRPQSEQIWCSQLSQVRGTTPWSAPICERRNSVSDIACHAQNCLGRYIIWHTCNTFVIHFNL